VRAFGETAAGSELDDSLLGRGVVFHAVDAEGLSPDRCTVCYYSLLSAQASLQVYKDNEFTSPLVAPPDFFP
jgi:hypothetical protein